MASVTEKLLVLDSSFCMEAIRQRGLEDSVTCRDLRGFFSHVWSVHPFASLVAVDHRTAKYGKPDWHALTEIHTFIDGKMGRFRFLSGLPPLNFLISQAGILAMLAGLVRREGISVIRAGDPLYLGLLGWALARLCRIPFVVRVGGNHDKVYASTRRPVQPRLFGSRRVEKIVERFVLSRADLVAGANEDNLNFALANGATPARSTLFRYGNLIDRRHFLPPAERGDAGQMLAEASVAPGRFLLYVGRLESVKHPEDVVRVLADVRRRGHDVKALLVGDGSLRSSLMEIAREHGVESQVVLAGNRNQEWLSKVIPVAGVVVSPHTGRALSEAALGAAPIVAYDVDWQAEVVKTGQTGELVPYKDWKGLADGAVRMLSDTAYAFRMGETARKQVLQMMSPEALDSHEREQYAKLLQSFRARFGKVE